MARDKRRDGRDSSESPPVKPAQATPDEPKGPRKASSEEREPSEEREVVTSLESAPELDFAHVANAEQEPGALDTTTNAPVPPVALFAKVWPHGSINWDGEVRQANEVFEVDTSKHQESDYVALCKAGTLVAPGLDIE